VYWIEPYILPTLFDERQGMIIAGEHNGTSPTSPGYVTWLTNRGLNDVSSVQVDITDTGCDSGEPENILHPDLKGRIAYIHDYTGDTGHDIDGHGTINVSIVGANVAEGEGTLDEDNYLYGLGIAPSVSLAATHIFNDHGEFDIGTSTLTDIVSAAQSAGTHIISNSWGAAVYGDYDATCQEYDGIVRDADRNPNNGLQPMIIFFAAGNEGRNYFTGQEVMGSIGSPAAAKNVIAVGASEKLPYDRHRWL
jgi:hypothetical protein